MGNNLTTSSEIHHLQYSVLPLKLPVMEHLCWLVILCTKVVPKLQHKTINWSFLGLFPALFVICSETRSTKATLNYPRLWGQRPQARYSELWSTGNCRKNWSYLSWLFVTVKVSVRQCRLSQNTLKCALSCRSTGTVINGPFTTLWSPISKSYAWWRVLPSKVASSILQFTLR